mmetsp:Transcript_57950/g.91667  ORF Transcript_57950/g.91667 Transcript_57950/m.91667 type:complete len:109 (-) Transcript_57950:77-403(-)
MADRFSAWGTAGFMLHYDRLLEATQEDPLRFELRHSGLALSKAIKAFASADLRARREQHSLVVRQRLENLGKDEGLPDPPADIQASEVKGAAPTSVTPAMPTSHVEGL